MITALHALVYAADPERAREARDDGWGITTDLQVPGGPTVMVYQPRYDPPALTL